MPDRRTLRNPRPRRLFRDLSVMPLSLREETVRDISKQPAAVNLFVVPSSVDLVVVQPIVT